MMRSAGPPSKKGAVDPDSPFAQLGALREALAKQAREKNPT
jgi:ATP-dependent RNA helicase SUPV3L1/SUV3